VLMMRDHRVEDYALLPDMDGTDVVVLRDDDRARLEELGQYLAAPMHGIASVSGRCASISSRALERFSRNVPSPRRARPKPLPSRDRLFLS
jgi:hypothetical protein